MGFFGVYRAPGKEHPTKEMFFDIKLANALL